MPGTSLSFQAYQRIKRKIVTLELAPGAVLIETRLRDELGLGRTPIREALLRLSLEKLVVISPRRGMFVSEIGITALQQLFEVRVVVESLAARLAAAKGNEDHWSRMEEALACVPDPGGAGDNLSLITVDESCHEIIYEAAGNEFLRDTLNTMYALSLRLWHFSLAGIGDMRRAVTEHNHILRALRSGDGDEAARLMEKHIRTFQDEIQSSVLQAVA
jgi:DNA-binding GntR family transcriptional regulator